MSRNEPQNVPMITDEIEQHLHVFSRLHRMFIFMKTIYVFKNETHRTTQVHENEKDVRRKMMAIRLRNHVSSTSVTNPNMKKARSGNLWISVENPMWWVSRGVSISQEGGVGGAGGVGGSPYFRLINVG